MTHGYCRICGRYATVRVQGRCETRCYSYWLVHGVERPTALDAVGTVRQCQACPRRTRRLRCGRCERCYTTYWRHRRAWQGAAERSA